MNGVQSEGCGHPDERFKAAVVQLYSIVASA